MKDKDTGGPAFQNDWDAKGMGSTGMTLRDYFAAKAMQGLLAADTEFSMSPTYVAKIAYCQADAMLKARE